MFDFSVTECNVGNGSGSGRSDSRMSSDEQKAARVVSCGLCLTVVSLSGWVIQ